ncbi:Uncharacterised protein [Citrobacter koseri]|uniref:Uncharacterized protein n=1 Tax=Citrobacter koseri TaxID=545 RepID=A0A2X2VB31_CITKO|nr:Uncharacterised protein [Citrobacter koseri]
MGCPVALRLPGLRTGIRCRPDKRQRHPAKDSSVTHDFTQNIDIHRHQRMTKQHHQRDNARAEHHRRQP